MRHTHEYLELFFFDGALKNIRLVSMETDG